MSSNQTNIEKALDLEDIDVDLFRSKSLWKPIGSRGVFGGQVVGQALASALKTADPKFQVHSLHSYLLLPGDNSLFIIYRIMLNSQEEVNRNYGSALMRSRG